MTLVLLATVVGVFIAIFTFIISIILRGIGWISLSKDVDKGFFIVTGTATVVLGFIFFISLLNLEAIKNMGIPEGIALLLVFSNWVIYSLIEWIAYLSIARSGKSIFYGSLISIVGIALLLITLLSGITVEYGLEAILALSLAYYIILIPLIISSLIATIGFLTLNVEELAFE